MTITRRKEKRKISLEELVLLKEYPTFKKWRALGKMTNFMTIFGGSPKVFYTGVLETNWSIEEIRSYIRQEKLYKLKEKMEEKYIREDADTIEYLTAASNMIDTFFTSYKGLKDRITRNQSFAKENGYIRHIYGGTRILTELMLQGEYDKKEYGRMIRNLMNIAANADIQNFESCIINSAMARVEVLEKLFIENNIDARMFNNIHDSVDFYVLKTDIDEFVKIVRDEFSRDYPEFNGIPLPLDFNIVDRTKGETYKHGQNI